MAAHIQRDAARHGAGPGRQSLREELQRHRLLLHHPHQPPHHPGDPGARWVPGAPPGLRVFGLGVSLLSSPRPLPAEVPRKPPPMLTSPAPTLDTLPNDLLLMLRPWKCTDDTMEIIITRSHLEVRALPACWGGGGSHPAPGAGGMRGGAGRAPWRELWARLVAFLLAHQGRGEHHPAGHQLPGGEERHALHAAHPPQPLRHLAGEPGQRQERGEGIRGGAGGVPIPPGIRDPIGGMLTATAQG